MKTEFHHIKKTTSYGHYNIIGEVNGKRVEVTTTNSDLWDSYNNDEIGDIPYYTKEEIKKLAIIELEKATLN